MATRKKNSSKNTNRSRSEKLTSIKFHYLKAANFRTAHIDGAIGSITTKGFLHMALFSERPPIPQQTGFKLEENNILGEEIEKDRITKEGVIRQLEIDLIINEETAADLRNWLDQRLEEFVERRQFMAKSKKGN